MPSDVFHCKQFSISQDRTAMKVGTDGMLLGAWTEVHAGDRVLDIGTGTGLLAMMMAQKGAVHIDAVEANPEVAEQAKENVQASPWPDQIAVYPTRIQEFDPAQANPYDLIICNPPYFSQGPNSPDAPRDWARSGKFLPTSDLLTVIRKWLTPNGRASLILPVEVRAAMEQQAGIYGLFAHRVLMVRPKPAKAVHRILLELRRGFPTNVDQQELTIRDSNGNYTAAYRALTQDFYLANT